MDMQISSVLEIGSTEENDNVDEHCEEEVGRADDWFFRARFFFLDDDGVLGV